MKIASNTATNPNGPVLARAAKLVVLGGCALALSACVSPKEQLAMDRGRCSDFGYAPGTDAFADCMMGTAQRREIAQEQRNLQFQAQMAADRRAREWQSERDRRARDLAWQAATERKPIGFAAATTPATVPVTVPAPMFSSGSSLSGAPRNQNCTSSVVVNGNNRTTTWNCRSN